MSMVPTIPLNIEQGSSFYTQMMKKLAKRSIMKDNGCLEWNGATKNGYGSFRKQQGEKSQHYFAHRIAYAIFKGPIPHGMFVLHSCDNPKCVNPAHLELGTHTQNQLDKMRKNRQAQGETFQRSDLTEDDIIFIRNSNKTGKQLGSLFDIHPNMVYMIKNRVWWKGVQ